MRLIGPDAADLKVIASPGGAEEVHEGFMAEFSMIGVHAEELHWLRMLVALLRHPDPGVAELARQALLYLKDAAGKRGAQTRGSCDAAG